MVTDLPTLMIVIALTALMMSGSTTLLAWRGQNTEGLVLWAVALLVYACGFVVLLDRMLNEPRLPSQVSLYLGNLCMTVSAACMLWAVYQFQRRVPPLWLAAGLPGFGVVFYAVALDWPLVRIGLGSLLIATQLALVMRALTQKAWRTPGRGAWLIIFGLGVALAAFALRLIGLGYGYPVGDYSRPSVMQTLTFLASFMSMMMTSIGFLYMVKERADEANQLLAVQDPLTGALNRRALTSALDRELQRASRSGEPLALLMVDVDHFKRINDTHGHLMGDHVLSHLVQLVSERVRAHDAVARFGGEEFVVVAPGTTTEGAMRLAESLRAAVAARPAQRADQVVPFTISVGVSAQLIRPTTSWQSMLDGADRALYQAKHQGRDRVVNADDLAGAPGAAPLASAA